MALDVKKIKYETAKQFINFIFGENKIQQKYSLLGMGQFRHDRTICYSKAGDENISFDFMIESHNILNTDGISDDYCINDAANSLFSGFNYSFIDCCLKAAKYNDSIIEADKNLINNETIYQYANMLNNDVNANIIFVPFKIFKNNLCEESSGVAVSGINCLDSFVIVCDKEKIFSNIKVSIQTGWDYIQVVAAGSLKFEKKSVGAIKLIEI